MGLNTPNEINDLKELFLIQPAVWLGNFSPFQAHNVNILYSNSYRLATELHGSYKAVWFYENLLSDIYAWKVILDEMIRLVDENGVLIIRIQQNDLLNIIELKNFLGRSIVLENVNILFEDIQDDVIALAIKIKRKNYSIYQNKKWSFAVLTQGNKVDSVVEFCKSIRNIDQEYNQQIIICGPQNDAYDEYQVDYISKNYSTKFAEISLKKNDIIDYASHSNILIAHDRYSLNNDFLVGFERYGYDFDFLTIRQQYENGNNFPVYLRLEKSMKWSTVSYTDEESFFDDRFFLNGGLLIFKKNTASCVKFNNLLFWNQAEDVEISRQMILNSIVPRQNYFSAATTINTPLDYTATFRMIQSNESYNRILTILINKLFLLAKRNLPSSWKNIIKKVLYK